MKNKTKKQHYVPQCYLENWSIPNTHQVYSYDKKQKESRKSNITDAASQRYFYDFDYTGKDIISILKHLNLHDENITKTDNIQLLEHLFAEEVEGDLSTKIKGLIERSSSITPWEINNCYFIKDEFKEDMSYHIAIQFMRVKQVRDNLSDMSNCLMQIFGNKMTDELKEYIDLSKADVKNTHNHMLLSFDNIESIKNILYNYIWIFVKNTTNIKIYTSDNPIITVPHIFNQFISTSGLKSEGVEVRYPISPELFLVMYEPTFHNRLGYLDRKIVKLSECDKIIDFNKYMALNCNRCVYSKDSDFGCIEELLKESPDIFDKPKIQVNWDGKTYYPK